MRDTTVQRTAWLTASLTGFAKVPAYEKCFPPVRPREKPKASSAALFAYFGDVAAERKAKAAHGR